VNTVLDGKQRLWCSVAESGEYFVFFVQGADDDESEELRTDSDPVNQSRYAVSFG
jgi:hypothetical protein